MTILGEVGSDDIEDEYSFCGTSQCQDYTEASKPIRMPQTVATLPGENPCCSMYACDADSTSRNLDNRVWVIRARTEISVRKISYAFNLVSRFHQWQQTFQIYSIVYSQVICIQVEPFYPSEIQTRKAFRQWRVFEESCLIPKPESQITGQEDYSLDEGLEVQHNYTDCPILDDAWKRFINRLLGRQLPVEVAQLLRKTHNGQVCFVYANLVIYTKQIIIKSQEIIDKPKFPHRGFLIDSSRHYLPVANILQFLDAMAMVKMNVLHWHIVDDQSFPFVSCKFPNLSAKGSYDPIHYVYSRNDVHRILDYSRKLGIRVMPEFDTPGHTLSWGEGDRKILTPCYSGGVPDGTYGPMNPAEEYTYEFLVDLFEEVTKVFPEQMFHLGGDEVPYECWASNPRIQDVMTHLGFGKDYRRLQTYYTEQVISLVHKITEGYKTVVPIVWQEVFDQGLRTHKDTIIQVWKGDWQPEMNNVTAAGYSVLLSSCWYLDYISSGIDWYKYYDCDPTDFGGSPEQIARVHGGEACLWGEYVDETNLFSRAWPRGVPVAERLWSTGTLSRGEFAHRLDDLRCQMVNCLVPKPERQTLGEETYAVDDRIDVQHSYLDCLILDDAWERFTKRLLDRQLPVDEDSHPVATIKHVKITVFSGCDEREKVLWPISGANESCFLVPSVPKNDQIISIESYRNCSHHLQSVSRPEDEQFQKMSGTSFREVVTRGGNQHVITSYKILGFRLPKPADSMLLWWISQRSARASQPNTNLFLPIFDSTLRRNLNYFPGTVSSSRWRRSALRLLKKSFGSLGMKQHMQQPSVHYSVLVVTRNNVSDDGNPPKPNILSTIKGFVILGARRGDLALQIADNLLSDVNTKPNTHSQLKLLLTRDTDEISTNHPFIIFLQADVLHKVCIFRNNIQDIKLCSDATHEVKEISRKLTRGFVIFTAHPKVLSTLASNPDIQKFMEQMHFGKNYSLLQTYYMEQIIALIKKIYQQQTAVVPVVWQEVFDQGLRTHNDTLIHVWKGNWQSEVKRITSAGFPVLLSSCWYLSRISYGIDWHPYYQCDPTDFGGTPEEVARIHGGEACMWGEQVDETNIFSRSWPRGAAVAERLWSHGKLSTVEFAGRLDDIRCQMVQYISGFDNAAVDILSRINDNGDQPQIELVQWRYYNVTSSLPFGSLHVEPIPCHKSESTSQCHVQWSQAVFDEEFDVLHSLPHDATRASARLVIQNFPAPNINSDVHQWAGDLSVNALSSSSSCCCCNSRVLIGQ
ncbi:hexosaminidase [Clonorchis sinensis]|uniref:beta-N-acetylhexosaminidase n=1 Tax=Clonorchis sinensis TaxID=79923 RepID=G7YPK0_CLOSI|nr:hexosaminidase [Clonorchis sinensis]